MNKEQRNTMIPEGNEALERKMLQDFEEGLQLVEDPEVLDKAAAEIEHSLRKHIAERAARHKNRRPTAKINATLLIAIIIVILLIAILSIYFIYFFA